MTPDERQMIADLFDRMRGVSADKDREAEAFINQCVRGTPDAAYLLVQSVLMQEFALQQSTARIEELEEQVRQLQQAGQPQRSSSGSFLGGLFGGSRQPEPPRASSVPAFGSRPASSPWGNQSSAGYSPPPRPSAVGATMAGSPAAPQSGGFLKSAMAAAAGVAGGMLLAESVRNMIGGSHANAATTGGNSSLDDNDPANSYGHQEPSYQDNDPANYSDDSWDSGDGNDIDI